VILSRAGRFASGVWTRLERHAVGLSCVVAALLALPTLTSPLLLDDLVHRAMLLGRLPGVHWSPLELYDFIGASSRTADALRDSGSVPWFAADDLKLRFFRPLSSALLAAEAGLDERWIWLARLQSLLWLLACLTLAAALYRRFLSRPCAALATLIYAVAPGHAMPVSWIAARYALVCTAFGLLSVWLHVRAREDGWQPGYWLSPAALAVGLLAGETALGAVALVAAWEVFGSRDPLPRRVRGAAPIAIVTLAYLAVYVLADYGAAGSGVYVGAGDGWDGAALLGLRVLILVAELVTATPSDAFGPGPPAIEIAGAAWGVVAAGAAWAVWRASRDHIPRRGRSNACWMIAAAAAATLPGTFGSLGGRVLPLALVPASAVVAMLIVGAWSTAVSARVHATRRWLLAAAGGLLVAGHLVLAPVVRLGVGLTLTRIAAETYDQAARAPSCPGVMVIVAAADPTIATYVPALLTLWDRGPERLRVLSMAPSDHRIEAVTATGFDLVTLDGDRPRSLWERLYRREGPAAGTHITSPSLEARVIEAPGDRPTRVRFDFGAPLESEALCFLQWRDGRLRPLRLMRGDETIHLPHEPGPMGW